ncbi:hypothetical protein [Okeania hirsuta]|nr:hypothetical protein [Okeania hirsuta]
MSKVQPKSMVYIDESGMNNQQQYGRIRHQLKGFDCLLSGD